MTTAPVTTKAPSFTNCHDPLSVFSEAYKIQDCTSKKFSPDYSCKFSCATDYHSSNPDKAKTQIVCKCDAIAGCNWEKKVEMECQGQGSAPLINIL